MRITIACMMVGIQAARVEAATQQGPALPGVVVSSIAVSPIYTTTGLVAVSGTLQQCQQSCSHVWVSHDGGASWTIATGQGYASGSPLAIAVDGTGRESLLAPNGSNGGYQTSYDAGQTWTSSAVKGRPTPLPDFATSRSLALAGGSVDTLVSPNGNQNIRGSSQSYDDGNFVYMPGFPSTGQRAPALLGAIDQRTATPNVLRCDTSLTCSSAVPLTGGNAFAGVPELLPAGDYASGGEVYARTNSAVYRSTDGAASFSPTVIDPPPAGRTNVYTGLALAPGYRQAGPVHTAFATIFQIATTGGGGATSGGVFRTTDGGTTWSLISAGTPMVHGAQSLGLAPDGRIFAAYDTAGSAGLMCSDDVTTWHDTCPARGAGQAAQSSGTMAPAGRAGGTRSDGAVTRGNGNPNGEAASLPARGPTPNAHADGAPQAAVGTRSPAPNGGGSPWWLLLGAALALGVGGAVVAVRLRGGRRRHA